MDQELKSFLEKLEARMDERDARMEARMDERDARMDERFAEMKEQVETEGRQTRILVEDMGSDLRLLAEGVMGVTERLETYQAETARGFQEVKAMLAPYYRNLNGRAESLEDDVQCLDRRLKVLEDRADRQTEDVLVAIRQKFGKARST